MWRAIVDLRLPTEPIPNVWGWQRKTKNLQIDLNSGDTADVTDAGPGRLDVADAFRVRTRRPSSPATTHRASASGRNARGAAQRNVAMRTVVRRWRRQLRLANQYARGERRDQGRARSSMTTARRGMMHTRPSSSPATKRRSSATRRSARAQRNGRWR